MDIFSGGLVSLRGKVYAFGGFGFERYDTVDVYDPVADTWSPCCSMREKRATMGKLLYIEKEDHCCRTHIYT